MGKKSRKYGRLKEDAYDEFDDHFDDDFDWKDVSGNIRSSEWDDGVTGDWEFTGDSRRKIERRRDMKRLYSQLDEWEEFGGRNTRL